jgi:DNA-binding transcriptional LysR family regulator
VEFKQLYYFITLAKYLSFTKAADSLYISQSTLSQQIIRLEREMGAELFHRNKRNVKLTTIGAEFLVDAKLLVEHFENIKTKYTYSSKPTTKVLKIGYLGPYVKSYISKLLQTFVQKHPHIQIEMNELLSKSLMESYENDELDIIFSITDENEWWKKYHSLKISSDQCSLIVPPQHRLASKNHVSLEELKEESLILLNKDVSCFGHTEIVKQCTRHGFNPKIILEPPNFETIATLVEINLGVAIIPDSFLQTSNHQVKTVPIKHNPFTFEFIASWKENSSIITSFVEEIDKIKEWENAT